MMKTFRYLLFALLMGAALTGWSQDPDLDDGKLVEETLDESIVTEDGTQTLMLDNSRSKIGRDFYDAFFRFYAQLPKTAVPVIPAEAKADTTAKVTPNVDLDLNAFVLAVDEMPVFGIGSALISVTLNDQIIWQNYVQIRQEIIEANAQNAAELANQYVLYYQEIQQQLDSEDQKGSGIF